MPIIALQMAAMYLGSAAGAAVGSSLLAAGTAPADLAAWALTPAVIALIFTGAISKSLPGRTVPATIKTSICSSLTPVDGVTEVPLHHIDRRN